MKSLTKADIVFSLRLGGIVPGDVVMLQSSLSSCGSVEGGAETVVDAFLEAVGAEGTLAVSTMSFNHPFDAANDPSTVGAISEAHRRRPDSIRSLRPVHCINAIGARAEELTKDHELCETNLGPGSPYQKLRDMGGKIVLLGVDLSRNTTMHAIEDIMDAVYLVNPTIPAPKYMEDYENKTMVMKKFCPGHRDFLRFGPVLRREGAMTEALMGNARALIIDAAKMFEIGERVLAEDPLFFLCRNENCEHCGPYRTAKKEA